MLDPNETICAIASPPGPAIRGVIRVSGPQTKAVLAGVLGPHSLPSDASSGLGLDSVKSLASPLPWRHATRSPTLLDLGFPLGIIEVDLLVWSGPRSYTGQDAAEIHTLGCPPILDAILQRVIASGSRLAEKGEFTLRSFLAGNIDLLQAEAVLGVIDAESDKGLGVALDQLTGGISNPLISARHQLLDLLADVEAGLDFVDEDIRFIEDPELSSRLSEIADAVRSIAETMDSRGRVSEDPVVVLQGLPNAGKSSLLNAVAGSEVAIVSEVIGTTRDPIEVRLKVANQTWRWVDTAGLESSTADAYDAQDSTIRAQAQKLASQIASTADVRLWCVDASTLLQTMNVDRGLPFLSDPDLLKSCLRVATKCDLLPAADRDWLESQGWITTSALRRSGIDLLWESVRRELQASLGDSSVAATAARCRESLQQTSAGLALAADLVTAGEEQEIVAAELRLALDQLGRVTGAIYTEEILDSIFSRFCIGK